MVEYANFEEFCRFLETLSYGVVGVRGRRSTRGMVVREDEGGRVVLEGGFHHFPWMHYGALQGAAKQLLKTNKTVVLVKKESAKHLVFFLGNLASNKLLCLSRVREGVAACQDGPLKCGWRGSECRRVSRVARIGSSCRSRRLGTGRLAFLVSPASRSSKAGAVFGDRTVQLGFVKKLSSDRQLSSKLLEPGKMRINITPLNLAAKGLNRPRV